MKIYTKTGDKGNTGTFEGRMSKDDIKAEALGAIDELNCWIGMCRELIQKSKVKDQKFNLKLKDVQSNLFVIGAILAGSNRYKFSTKETKKLENLIDKLDKDLPKLHNFIYPNNLFQVARAVARRAERRVVSLQSEVGNRNIYKYLNRLSDVLFVIGRWWQQEQILVEEVWKV